MSQKDVPISRCRSFCFLSSELIPLWFRKLFSVDRFSYLLIINIQLWIWFACLLNWSVMRLQICSDIKMEFWYSISHNSSNIGIPNTPSRGAKDDSFLSFSVIIIPPVINWINSVRITSSTFRNKCVGLFSYNNRICAYNPWKSRCKHLVVLFLQFCLIHEVYQSMEKINSFPWYAHF